MSKPGNPSFEATRWRYARPVRREGARLRVSNTILITSHGRKPTGVRP